MGFLDDVVELSPWISSRQDPQHPTGGGHASAFPSDLSGTAWTNEPCQFSYARFHLYFTIPQTILLYLLTRPFLTQLDRAKLIILPIIAFVWTTPWDNELVRQRAWRYPRSCVIGTVGYVPYEEYFFFLIQSVMTILLTSFVTRWSLPTLHLFQSKADSRRVLSRPATISLFVCGTAFAAGIAMISASDRHPYYMGMILWWSSLPLGLLWWGSSNFVIRMPWKVGKGPFLFCVTIPTVYLWGTDIFALRRGTWHINEATSFNVFPIPDLPIEEMVFFFVTNLLLVIASFTFDRCIALARLGLGVKAGSKQAHWPPYSPNFLPLDLTSITSLWTTFIAQDPIQDDAGDDRYDGPYADQRDLEVALRILKRASRSFSMASLLLPWDLRIDLSILYAFCRAADDCVDDTNEGGGATISGSRDRSEGREAKNLRMSLLRDLVDAIYKPDSSSSEAKAAIRDVLHKIGSDGPTTRSRSVKGSSKGVPLLTPEACEELRASASLVVSLRHLVPRNLWDELIRGYARDLRLDLEGFDARFETMDELVEYAQCVAGCVGEMCVRVVLGRCGLGPIPPTLEELGISRRIDVWKASRSGQTFTGKEKTPSPPPAPPSTSTSSSSLALARYLIYHARHMGVSLQLVNISRDVLEDSTKLGRCYLPTDYVSSHWPSSVNGVVANDINVEVDVVQSLFSSQPPDALLLHKHLILPLLPLSLSLYHASYPSLSHLDPISPPVTAGLRAACKVYIGIADAIDRRTEEEVRRGKRATLSRSRRIAKALGAVYLG